MLFNSYPFLLVFLPLTFAGFFLLARFSHLAAAAWLAVASLAFYGWWDATYLWLLLGSICGNFFFGTRIGRAVAAGRRETAKTLLVVAIVANMALLAYYKYATFVLTTVDTLVGADWAIGQVILPLGISFFTFTQIAFLVDTYRGEVREYRFVHYVLFVTYFPHLIAGPVLHHKEMMPQFERASTYRIQLENLSVGLTIFALGLAKKVILADGIAPYADEGFDAAAAGGEPAFFQAWSAALCYTLQLYFDFSGYSDMAIGLSRMFGVTLPLNFFSPYKAVNISEFWRRWHMTLSRFLRDYLYIPLGGNRRGPVKRYRNLMITMLLGGLWHGAGWTFVAWGGLHGAYLVVNHAWLHVKQYITWIARVPRVLRLGTARMITLLAVIVGWVFFRATSFGQAMEVLSGMAGLHGVTLPAGLEGALGPLAGPVAAAGVTFEGVGGSQFVKTWLWIAALLPIALFAPNVAEIMRRYAPALDVAQFVGDPDDAERRDALAWRPSRRWALATAALGAVAMLSLFKVSEFLYYQF
jgi:D-alanyl-lipoteichoic acid acyltransferase DltB (MBOAT superfamily)